MIPVPLVVRDPKNGCCRRTLPIHARELTHEQIRIKKEDNERDLNERSPERLEPGWRRERRHEAMIPAQVEGPKRIRT